MAAAKPTKEGWIKPDAILRYHLKVWPGSAVFGHFYLLNLYDMSDTVVFNSGSLNRSFICNYLHISKYLCAFYEYR